MRRRLTKLWNSSKCDSKCGLGSSIFTLEHGILKNLDLGSGFWGKRNIKHGTSNIQPEECSFNVPRHTVPGDGILKDSRIVHILPRLVNLPESTAADCIFEFANS